MISTTIVLFTLSLLAPSYVLANNDWSVPCVTGSCSWDTGDGKTTAYSSMAISGTNNLLSDITPAAGWNIQGCDPNWASGEHTVQIMCSGSTKQTALCSHLFDGGAENTIVRLPENCGKGPFARVASISNSTGSSIARRKEGVGSQHTIQLDYKFSKIPTSRGKAAFAITSTNIPGLPGVSKRDLLRLRGRGRAGALHRRKFGQLQERSSIGDAASSASNFVGNAADAVTSAAVSAATAIGNAVSSANTIDKTLDSGPLTPVNFDKDVTLFDQSISCDSGDVSGSASLKVDVEGNVQATVSFGATIVGTIVPPEVSDFSVNANLGGSASATFTVDATAQGQFGTGKVSLFKTGLPGLSIPSVITIGPEFSVDGSIDMDIEAEAKMVINAGWDFPSLKLVFPASKGGSTGSATVSGTDNPLQLSADPSVDISGTVTGHLIPRVDFGIDLFDGTAQASVFIDADTSASVNMEVKASAQIDNSAASNTTSAAAADPTSATGNNSTVAAAGNNSTDTGGNNNSTDTDVTGGNNSTDIDAAGGNNGTDTDFDPDGGDNSTDTDPTGASGNSTSTDAETDSLDNDTNGNSTSTEDTTDTTQGDENGDDTDGLDGDSTGNSTSTDPAGDTTDTGDENGDDTDGLDGDSAGNSTSADADADATEPDEDLDGTEDGTDPADGDITDDGTEDDGDAQSDTFGDDTQNGDGTEDDNSGDSSVDDGFGDPSVDDGLDSSSDSDDGSESDTVDDGSNDTEVGDGSDAGLDDSGDDDSSVDDTTDDSGVDDTADDSGVDDTADDSSVDDTADSGVDDTADSGVDDTADDSGVDDTSDDSGFDDSSDDSDDTADDSGADDTGFNETEDQDTSDDDTADDSTLDDSDATDDGTTDDSDDTDSFFRKRDDSGSVSGCVTVNAAIDVTAGLTGSLEPFITDATTSFDIFSTQTQIFQRCLGNGQERRALRRRRRAGVRRVIMPRAGDSSGLQCPAKLVNALTSLI